TVTGVQTCALPILFVVTPPDSSCRQKPFEIQPAFPAPAIIATVEHHAEVPLLEPMHGRVELLERPPGVQVEIEVASRLESSPHRARYANQVRPARQVVQRVEFANHQI